MIEISGRRMFFKPYAIFSLIVLAIVVVGFVGGLDPVFAGPYRVRRCILPVILLGVTFVAAFWWAKRVPTAALLPDRERRPAWPIIGVISLAALVVTAFIADYGLNKFPMSGDEYVYLLQARMFELGKLWLQPWPLQKYFGVDWVFEFAGRLITVYPPGWPALLAGAAVVGIPNWLVNPILGALTIPVLYLIALRRYDAATGLLAVCIFAGSAFFAMNTAAFFSHPAVTLFGLLFALAGSEYLERPSVAAALGVGAALSAIALTRHWDAVLFAVPAAAMLCWRSSRARWRLVPLVVVGALPLVAALLAYYWAVTGNPLQPTMSLLDPADRPLGAHLDAVRSTVMLFGRAIELAEWTSAPFLAVYLWALARRAWRRELHFIELYGVIFPLGYWLYSGTGGLRWGPRYIYCAFPFMALTAAAAIRDVLLDQGAARSSRVAAYAGVLSIAISVAWIPFLASDAGGIARSFQDLYKQVAAARPHHALVLVASGTGVVWHQDTGDLVRNGLDLDGDVIYAHTEDYFANQATPAEAAAAIAELHAAFPDRDIWVYQRKESDLHGHLTEWKPK